MSTNTKRYVDLSPDERKEYHRNYYRSYKTKQKAARVLNTYNLTVAQCDDIWRYQGGQCAICKTEIGRPSEVGVTTHIDHDHDTGKVRGLLCPHCNLMLGHAKDNPETLRTAARYLELHQG